MFLKFLRLPKTKLHRLGNCDERKQNVEALRHVIDTASNFSSLIKNFIVKTVLSRYYVKLSLPIFPKFCLNSALFFLQNNM